MIKLLLCIFILLLSPFSAFGNLTDVTYKNEEYGFEFKYPYNSQRVVEGKSIKIDLPFSTGTTLSRKYLKLVIKQSTHEECSNPAQTAIEKTEIVRINGVEFKKEIGEDHAAGSTFKSISYSTMKKTQCISLIFVFVSVNPGAFDNPPEVFDLEKESKNLKQLISTFQFTDQ